MTKTPKIIQSVQRAADIIACFHGTPVELSLSEISDTLGLNKSTAHGIISTLCINNFLEQSPSGKYRLGRVFSASFGDDGNTRKMILKEKAQQPMQRLADRFSGSTALLYREGNELIILNRITPSGANYVISVHDSVINPLHTSASGKLLLSSFGEDELESYLERNPLIRATEHTICTKEALKEDLGLIRSRQYSTENEELGPGIYAVSVPIYDKTHRFCAALSITGLDRFIRENGELVRELKETADTLSHQVFY